MVFLRLGASSGDDRDFLPIVHRKKAKFISIILSFLVDNFIVFSEEF